MVGGDFFPQDRKKCRREYCKSIERQSQPGEILAVT